MHFKSSLVSLLGVMLVGLVFAASSFAATPTNSVAPSISGYAHVGYTLTAGKGTWVGASTYAYTWQISVNSGSSWTDITGATKSTYKPVVGDASSEVRVQIVATSSKKEASSPVSSSAVTIGNSAPTSVAAPALTVAYAHVGYAIKAGPGTWDAPSPSLKYQWQQCDSSGANCVDIAKATGSSYTPVVADVAKKLRVGVTPTNSLKQAATSPTYSAVTAAIGNAAPSNTVLPAIAGYLHNGYTVTANAGTWDAPKPSAKYQWQLCDSSGANCVDIAKATSASFAIPHGPDAGKTLAVTVTVTNAAQQTTSISSGASDVIGSAAPSSTAVPTLSGNAYVGQTLTAAVGTWDAPKPTVAYQWQICTDNSDPTTCSDITGATKSTYKLLLTQAAKYLRVGEKATNVEKLVSSFSYSLVSGSVSSSQAKPTSAVPTIDDTTPNVGDVLTATHGSWGGSPGPDVYLSVAPLRDDNARRRRQDDRLHVDRERDRRDLHDRLRRPRQEDPRHSDRQELRRLRGLGVRCDLRGCGRPRSVEQRSPEHHGHSAGRPGSDRSARHLGPGADGLHLPVAGLGQRHLRLVEPERRDELHLRRPDH